MTQPEERLAQPATGPVATQRVRQTARPDPPQPARLAL